MAAMARPISRCPTCAGECSWGWPASGRAGAGRVNPPSMTRRGGSETGFLHPELAPSLCGVRWPRMIGASASEHAFEDRVDLLEMMFEVELGLELVRRQKRR